MGAASSDEGQEAGAGGVEARRTVLVLGGGGMKGLAHVGAWQAISEAGVEVAEIVGTSIGALVGAAIAGGVEHTRLRALARALQKTDIVVLNRWALLLNGIRQQSIFRDDVFREYLARVLPAGRFDELAIPLGVNAVDLGTGEQEWFGAGGRQDVPLLDAIYASCALPVFFPPAAIDGRYFVDGGVLDALALDRAAARGADQIIAVDVGAGGQQDADAVLAQGMIGIHHRVMQVMGNARKTSLLERWSGPELVYVRPELGSYSTFDFGSTEFFLEEGYRATRAVLSGELPVRELAG